MEIIPKFHRIIHPETKDIRFIDDYVYLDCICRCNWLPDAIFVPLKFINTDIREYAINSYDFFLWLSFIRLYKESLIREDKQPK